jgi:uncharacterized integral membrane protein
MGLFEIAAGPLVAVIGIISVFFVMRHRSVQTKSMYSARRSQIERKVRAARQRSIAPTSKHAEQEAAQAATFAAPGMEAKTAIPTATWGPPAARPDMAPPPPPPPQEQQAWEVGPTVPPPPPSMAPPTPPPYTPSAPTYAPPPEEVWNPAPAETFAPAPSEPIAEPVAPVSTPAGGGASWSIVGEGAAAAAAADKAPDKRDKKDKKGKEKRGQTGASWQLAAGELPGAESDDIGKKPSAAIAVAQYAVLVVGLVMVLIGVVVMVANSHVT